MTDRREQLVRDYTHSRLDGSMNREQSARWLSVEQIRKQQRMRRKTVITAMLTGALPYEQRGRIRYARVSDVEAWEHSRVARSGESLTSILVHPDLVGLS